MANEEKEENVAEEEESPKKKSSLLPMIIILVVLLIALGGGFFAWQKFMAAPPAGEKKVVEEKKKEQTEPSIFKLETFVVNLARNAGRRYLKTTLELELNDKLIEKEIRSKLAQIRDSILILLSGKSFDDVNTVGGKYKLKDEIITRINTILLEGRVRQIYFTEFVVQ